MYSVPSEVDNCKSANWSPAPLCRFSAQTCTREPGLSVAADTAMTTFFRAGQIASRSPGFPPFGQCARIHPQRSAHHAAQPQVHGQRPSPRAIMSAQQVQRHHSWVGWVKSGFLDASLFQLDVRCRRRWVAVERDVSAAIPAAFQCFFHLYLGGEVNSTLDAAETCTRLPKVGRCTAAHRARSPGRASRPDIGSCSLARFALFVYLTIVP